MPNANGPTDHNDLSAVLDFCPVQIVTFGTQANPGVKNYLAEGTLNETRALRREIDRRRTQLDKEIACLATIEKFTAL